MTSKFALEDLKVVEFGEAAVGPLITMYLADHGASVVKVETHTHVDSARTFGPYKSRPPTLDTAGFFTRHNSSKYSVTLNLNKPDSLDVAFKLVQWADVFVENMRAGVIGKLGLDYETVCKVKPDIIYLSSCMYGQYGPCAHLPGYGQLASSLGGVFYMCGWPDENPSPPYGAYSDYIAPLFGVSSILAALDYRNRTGKGQYIDVSQVETTIHFVAPVVMDYLANGRILKRDGNRCPDAAPHNVFPCKGHEQWVAIAVFSDEQWEKLCRVMEKPIMSSDSRFFTFLARKKNEDILNSIIEEWTINHTPEEIIDILQTNMIPSSKVESNKDLFNDPQLACREHFQWQDHPAMGSIALEAPAFRLSKTPFRKSPAPTLGQHNEFVYRQLLGMSDEDIARLVMDGIITTEADLPGEWAIK